jgi:hypothetical protein
MSVASRPVSTGKTRTCPHCKATILESLSICPGCMHHLRFDSEAAKRQVAAAPALRVEGVIRHPPLEPPLEYYVIIAIRNDRGEEVTRQVVNVGALQAAEKRTFTLSVEVLPPQAPVPPQKSNSSTSTAATGTFRAPVVPTALPSPAVKAPATATAQPAPTSAAATSTPASNPVLPAATASNQKPATGAAPTPPAAAGPPKSTSGIPKPPQAPSHTLPTSPRLTPSTTPPPPASGANPNAPKSPPLNNPAKPAPQGGYPGGLKPPNPGGPKRH